MQLCISTIVGTLKWFKEIRFLSESSIKLSLFAESEFDKVFKAALTEEFDVKKGPLWHVKVCPNTKDCAIPEVKKDFPYQYNVIFVFHHAISDEHSNLRIYNHFLNILNDVIKNKPIDNSTQLGIHFDHEAYTSFLIRKPVIDPVTEQFQRIGDTEIRERHQYYAKKVNESKNLLIGYYKDPTAEQILDTIYHDFSTEVTEKIIRSCKKHEVSVTSFLTSVVSSGVYDLLQETEFKGRKWYDLPHFQMVNGRRYLLGTNDDMYGELSLTLVMFAQVQARIKTHFWYFVKDYHKDLKNRLDTKACFSEEVRESSPESEYYILDDTKKHHPSYFVINNVGIVDTNLFPGTGDSVQVTHMKRSISMHRIMSIHQFCTFRGRLLYSIDFWPPFIPKSVAEKWLKFIIQVIDENIQ